LTEIKILSEKQPNRTDSFFYADPIAEATAKDGTVFTSYPVGEVVLTIGDTQYDNDRRFGKDDFDILTDDDLSGENDNVEWQNNNWFSIVADKDGEAYWDLEMVDFDYDSAISTLEDLVAQYDRGELELR
jgi:hypothetical protein